MGRFRRLIARLFRIGREPSRLLLMRFMERYMNRTIIVHSGLPADWVAELLKEPGGAGHFRFDVRRAPGPRPTPVEWVVHRHVLVLGLPLPLILQVREDGIRVRHLRRGGHILHPSELVWLLDEIGPRHHARLFPTEDGLAAETGMAAADNRIEYPYGTAP